MILKNTLNYLIEKLIKSSPDKKFNDKLKKVLCQLKERLKNLKIELENEKNEEQCRHIHLQLKVIAKQIEKGERMIQKRDINAHSSQNHKLNTQAQLSPPVL